MISDVSPEDSVSGQKLLYRLLASWEPSALCVYEGNVWPSDPARRLPGIPYETVAYAPERLFRSRLQQPANALLLHLMEQWTPRLCEALRRFGARAVLTVAHGHLMLLAAAVARELAVPLHLLLHDDWPTIFPAQGWLAGDLHARFKAVYRQAASRLCVSPYMEEEYRRRYGVPGAVLLPSREPGTPPGMVRVRSERAKDAPFVLAYAGSIPVREYMLRLRMAAEAVRDCGGLLDLYTNVAAATLEREGLAGPHVRPRGFLPPHELHACIGASADALFLPMSFAAEDRATMSVCFPSKLVEYTAIGLPIVVWGPEHSAGARWVTEQGGAAAVVTAPELAAFKEKLQALASGQIRAEDLARPLVEAGNRWLTHARALETFRSAVAGAATP